MKSYKLFNKIEVSFLGPFLGTISIERVVKEIETKIPFCLFSEVDVIYVGDFDFLNNNDLSSKFMDSAIYISNDAHYEKDVIYDITSGVAESIEQRYAHFFYERTQIIHELTNYFNDDEQISEYFTDAIYELLIENNKNMKENMPLFSGVLEEIIKNG
jgi:hypothetical protein